MAGTNDCGGQHRSQLGEGFSDNLRAMLEWRRGHSHSRALASSPRAERFSWQRPGTRRTKAYALNAWLRQIRPRNPQPLHRLYRRVETTGQGGLKPNISDAG